MANSTAISVDFLLSFVKRRLLHVDGLFNHLMSLWYRACALYFHFNSHFIRKTPNTGLSLSSITHRPQWSLCSGRFLMQSETPVCFEWPKKNNVPKFQLQASFFKLTTKSEMVSSSPCEAVQNLCLSVIIIGFNRKEN